jgi:hypothetical protein
MSAGPVFLKVFLLPLESNLVLLAIFLPVGGRLNMGRSIDGSSIEHRLELMSEFCNV